MLIVKSMKAFLRYFVYHSNEGFSGIKFTEFIKKAIHVICEFRNSYMLY